SGEDGTAEAVLHQCRQVAAVVYVRVGKDHRVNGIARKGEVAVDPVCVFAPALEEPAVEKVSLAAGFEHVHGAGDGAGSAPERELHEQVIVAHLHGAFGRLAVKVWAYNR